MKDALQPAPLEPVWYLRSIPYSEYRESAWWRQRRAQFMATRARRCERCGIETIISRDRTTFIDKRPRFNVHHITYENLGFEKDEDLELICSSCHDAEHYPESRAAIFWKTEVLPAMAEAQQAQNGRA